MKKTVISIIGLAVIGAAATFNVIIGLRSESFSDLTWANIEALAQVENGGQWSSNPCDTEYKLEGGLASWNCKDGSNFSCSEGMAVISTGSSFNIDYWCGCK